MEGLVSCIKHYSDPCDDEYFIVAREGGALKAGTFKSKVVLQAGEMAGFALDDDMINSVTPFEGAQDAQAFISEAYEESKKAACNDARKTGAAGIDSVTSKIWGTLCDAAALLIRKLLLGAPIVIRFHNDVDGASGAYCLDLAMKKAAADVGMKGYAPNTHWRMHGGVIYTKEDESNDMLVCNGYECQEKPLLILLDFGTAKESNEGVELARRSFEIIWLDHHPLVEGFEGKDLAHYVNPWMHGSDSNYTAGFLTCMFSRTFSNVESEEMENASFIGDYSTHVRPGDSGRRLAILLDLLTSDTRLVTGSRSMNLDLEDVDKVIKDKKKSDELIAYAQNRVLEMLDSAISSVKVHRGESASIYVADFENIRGGDDQRYPLPGRFASKLLDKIEELNKQPCVLVLHFGQFISIRMSKALNDKINVLEMIEAVKRKYPEDIDSGGGHSNAASIKLRSDKLKKEIIKAVVESLK